MNFCSDCESVSACIFVVKVEGALHFSLGGRLFLIYTLIVVKRSIMTPW